MKRLVTVLIVIILSTTIKAQEATKVLFIGNSITYFNDMPETFEGIANSLGNTTEITMHAPGGTGFANHVDNPTVYELFRNGDWDYIVLQPGTGDSGGESIGGTPKEGSLVRIRILLDSIYLHNPCSQVMFFEISNGVWSNSAEDLATYNGSMDLIFSNLKYFSDSTQLPLAPVGEAFRTTWNNNLNTLLWNSTGDIHPNAKGSYLAACVFYASIFQMPSLGSTELNNLTQNEAEQYQYIADTTVLNHQSKWGINIYNRTSNFEFETINDTSYFTDLSENIDSLVWHFGDGNQSMDEDPFHIYSNNADYQAKLITYKHGCTDTITKTVSIIDLSTKSIENKKLAIVYPNPTNAFINIELQNTNEVFQYELFNSAGESVLKTKESKINVSYLPKGIYFLKLVNIKNSETEIIQWIKI